MSVQRTFLVFVTLVVGTAFGCDHPNPLAPAEPIGEFPQWGLDFTAEGKAGAGANTMFNPESGKKPTTGATSQPAGNGAAQAHPGQALFVNNCALCHGSSAGGGNNMPGVGMVPSLRDAAWQGKMSDEQIAAVILNGKGRMPAFKGRLDEATVKSIVTWLRTQKE